MRWPLLLLLAVLPLQWFVVLGPLRLHLVALVLFLALTLLVHRGSAWRPPLRETWAFVAANAALSVVWAATNAYHGLGVREPVQQLAYLAVFLAVATVVHRGLASPGGRWVETLRWSALAAAAALVSALSVSMALNGVNPAAVLGSTIASADPEVLQKELFRSAFVGFGFDEDSVNGNFRHEVFGAVLVAMTTSAACTALRPFRPGLGRVLYLLSMGLCTALVVLSLSRSVILALSFWPVLAMIRAVLALRLNTRLVGGVLVGLAAVAGLAASGLLTVLVVRFTQDTGSYEARDGLLERAFENIGSHAGTGGVSTVSASSHNFVLDSWLRSGVVGAVLAALVTLTARVHREPRWVLPVAAMLALPLVRIFTAGGGLIPPVSWVGLGLAAGFLAYRRTLLDADDGADGADGTDAADRVGCSSTDSPAFYALSSRERSA